MSKQKNGTVSPKAPAKSGHTAKPVTAKTWQRHGSNSGSADSSVKGGPSLTHGR